MKVKVIYRPNGREEDEVQRLLGSLKRFDAEPEVVDVDSREGQHLVEIYDVVSHPAVLVTKDDGGMVRLWKDDLPKPSDISYFLH